MLYYVDTSALYKRYRTELGSPVVDELLTRCLPSDEFRSSFLTALELEATAARALRGRVIDAAAYYALLGQFAVDLNRLVALEDLDMGVASRALGYARSYGLRAPDAIHLATALALPSAKMVTSDRELHRAAAAEGMDVLDPEDSGAMARLHGYRQQAE